MACTAEQFVSGMVSAATKNPAFVGFEKDKHPVLDVTGTAAQVLKGVAKAYLTIYAEPKKIKVLGPFQSQPQPLGPSQIVANWLNGMEAERQKCTADGLWYWVYYPSKLTVIYTDGTKKTYGHGDTSSMMKVLGALGLVLLGLDFLGTRGMR